MLTSCMYTHCSGRGATARPLSTAWIAVETSSVSCPAAAAAVAAADGAWGEPAAATAGLGWAGLIRPLWVLLLCICLLLPVPPSSSPHCSGDEWWLQLWWTGGRRWTCLPRADRHEDSSILCDVLEYAVLELAALLLVVVLLSS